MGKLMYGIIMVLALQLGLVMVVGQSTNLMSTVFNLGKGLYDFGANSLIGSILAILAVGGTVAVVAGLYLVRNEWIFYASLSVTFLSFGATIVQLWNWIASKTLDVSIGLDTGSQQAIATIICGGLAIMFVFMCLDFSSPGRGMN